MLFPIVALTLFACTDNDDKADIPKAPEPKLIVKFKFDPTQVRLNNLGQPSTVAAGNAAQSPIFNTICSHYLEFAPNAKAALGFGTILYHGQETTTGGSSAFDFSKAIIVA